MNEIRQRLGRCVLFGVATALAGLVVHSFSASKASFQEPASTQREATEEEVHRLCAACHAYPSPDTFPRSAWRKEVKQGYDFFFKDLSYRFDFPPLESVVRYYEKRAPESLPRQVRSSSSTPLPVGFVRGSHNPAEAGPPGVTHLNPVRLLSKDKLELILCDALKNQVLLFSPSAWPSSWTVLARNVCCARAEIADLDGDGHKDVVLACLGTFHATDDRVGSVVWLRGKADGTFTSVTLLDGIGRVADVQPADFNGDGKIDLVVAEFGWHQTGSILLLENHTTDPNRPVFTPKTLDSRHGTTHVPVADLNGDSRPDFVAVISQEHEIVVAFLNEGGGRFRRETIYKATDPSYGMNGIALADLDKDGDVDVILTNGDSLDIPYMLRPQHGIAWLENEGSYPFKQNRLTDCYGIGSPAIADFDGNGLPDIAYVTFLPGSFFTERVQLQIDSVGVLLQMAPKKFSRHALESGNCDHLSCAACDVDADGRIDLVVGDMIRGGKPGPNVSIWRNIGTK